MPATVNGHVAELLRRRRDQSDMCRRIVAQHRDVEVVLLEIRDIVMDDVRLVGVLQGVAFKSVYLFERMAVGGYGDAVKHLQDLVFVEDVRLLAGEILCGEHKIVGEAEGLHDVLGSIDGIEESRTVFAVGLHGVGVINENGDDITFTGRAVAFAQEGGVSVAKSGQ